MSKGRKINKVDTFPVWKPQRTLIKLFKRSKYDFIHTDWRKEKYKKARISSLNFTSRKDVRAYFLLKHGGGCAVCGSTIKLEIDHKISVIDWVHSERPILGLNEENNLWLLCSYCHTNKALFL